jgi:hypothetical protein
MIIIHKGTLADQIGICNYKLSSLQILFLGLSTLNFIFFAYWCPPCSDWIRYSDGWMYQLIEGSPQNKVAHTEYNCHQIRMHISWPIEKQHSIIHFVVAYYIWVPYSHKNICGTWMFWPYIKPFPHNFVIC